MMILWTVRPTAPEIGSMFTIITNANLSTAASQAAIYKTAADPLGRSGRPWCSLTEP
jgi:hypothetical protein